MATAAQVAANQQNALLSTGPRTEAGRLAVSRNAEKHRLASKTFFLSPDEKAAFDDFRHALAERYRPATDHERNLLQEFAEAKWRCRTALAMETSFLDVTVKDQTKTDPALSVEHALTRVFTDETLQKRMRLLMRYVSSAERAAEKARLELERNIAIREEEEHYRAQLAARARRAQALSAANASASPAAVAHAIVPVQNKPNSPLIR